AEVVARALRAERPVHGPREIEIVGARPHGVAQRHRAAIGEARAKVSLRADAQAVALGAELVAHGGDEADAAARAVGGAHVARGAVPRVARGGRLAIHARAEALEDPGRAQEALAGQAR